MSDFEHICPEGRCRDPATCKRHGECIDSSEFAGLPLRRADGQLAYGIQPATAETPASIIEELTAPHGLRLLDGDSAAPTHADTAPVRTAQLLRWHGITRLDLPPERILDAAQADDLRCVVVLGYKADGSEYFASSLADGADVLWLLERLKLQLLTTGAETDPT